MAIAEKRLSINDIKHLVSHNEPATYLELAPQLEPQTPFDLEFLLLDMSRQWCGKKIGRILEWEKYFLIIIFLNLLIYSTLENHCKNQDSINYAQKGLPPALEAL